MVRTGTFMDVLKDIKPDSEDYQTLCGGIVAAKYGEHTFYRIAGIDYNMTPMSTFTVTFGEKAG